MIEKLEENLTMFNLAQLQDFRTVARILVRLNLSLEQYIKFVESKIDTVVISRPVIRKCPNCSHILGLFPVNISKATQTGDGSKSVWICSKCHYEQFNFKSIRDLIKGQL